MGNRLETMPARIKNACNPSMNGWTFTQKGDLYNIWKNNNTGQELQEYQYNATDLIQYNKIKELFVFRFERQFLVTSKYLKQASNNQFCSTYYSASVFLERIGFRLSTLKDISYPSILHVYHASLRGFFQLYEKIGYFPINQQMIGVNSQGRVKVWVNSNFGANSAQFGSRFKTQKDMVAEILEIVDYYSYHNSQPEQIFTFFNQNLGFQQTLNLLYDYASKYSIQIPSRLDPKDQIIHQAYLNMLSDHSEFGGTITPTNEQANKQRNLAQVYTSVQPPPMITQNNQVRKSSVRVANAPIKSIEPIQRPQANVYKNNQNPVIYTTKLVQIEPNYKISNKLSLSNVAIKTNNQIQSATGPYLIKPLSIQKQKPKTPIPKQIIYKPQNQSMKSYINNNLKKNKNKSVNQIQTGPNFEASSKQILTQLSEKPKQIHQVSIPIPKFQNTEYPTKQQKKTANPTIRLSTPPQIKITYNNPNHGVSQQQTDSPPLRVNYPINPFNMIATHRLSHHANDPKEQILKSNIPHKSSKPQPNQTKIQTKVPIQTIRSSPPQKPSPDKKDKKKHQYVYQFDVPVEEENTEEVQHIKIIINSQKLKKQHKSRIKS